jgi:hypothetical protein
MVKHFSGAATQDPGVRRYGSYVVHKDCEKVAITFNETSGRITCRQSDVDKNIVRARQLGWRVVADVLQ